MFHSYSSIAPVQTQHRYWHVRSAPQTLLSRACQNKSCKRACAHACSLLPWSAVCGLLFAVLQGLHGPEHVALQGAQAHAAGVLFPSDDEVLQRTILIANINPLINTEQVRSHLPIYVTCDTMSCMLNRSPHRYS